MKRKDFIKILMVYDENSEIIFRDEEGNIHHFHGCEEELPKGELTIFIGQQEN